MCKKGRMYFIRPTTITAILSFFGYFYFMSVCLSVLNKYTIISRFNIQYDSDISVFVACYQPQYGP